MTPTPAQVFRQEYGTSRNFMTPRRLGPLGGFERGPFVVAIEISEGTGFNHNLIYGVTVAVGSMIDHNAGEETWTRRGAHPKLSKLFHAKPDALHYSRALRRASQDQVARWFGA